MGLSAGLVAAALSSNIPTGVLVDCCFLVSSAVFQLFVFFSVFTALNFAGLQQSSRNFIEGKGRGTSRNRGMALQCTLSPFATRMGPCRGAQGVEGGKFGVWGGGL